MRRTTRKVPPSIQLRSRRVTQTWRSRSLPRRGLAVASLKPSRLRGRPFGLSPGQRCIDACCDQRTTAPPRVTATRRASVPSAPGSVSAHTWRPTSPPLVAGSSASPGNAGSSASATGRRAARPKRPSKIPGPKPRVMVTLPAGPPVPRWCPARIRRSDSSVSSPSRSRRSAARFAVTSSAAKASDRAVASPPRAVGREHRRWHVVGAIGLARATLCNRNAPGPDPAAGTPAIHLLDHLAPNRPWPPLSLPTNNGDTVDEMPDRAFPVIYAQDVARTVAFYQRLGFEERFRLPPDGEAGYVGLRSGDAELAIVTVDSPRQLLGAEIGKRPRFELFIR